MEKIYTCNICGAESSSVPFYARVTSRCKECHKACVRKNRAEKVEYYRAYDAKRFQEDPRVKARHEAYQASEKGKESLRKSRRKWLAENADKRAAHVLLGNRVRDGVVSKPETCSMCGAGGRIHGHHEDYAQPLNVIWCCPACHRKLHTGEASVSIVDGAFVGELKS